MGDASMTVYKKYGYVVSTALTCLYKVRRMNNESVPVSSIAQH